MGDFINRFGSELQKIEDRRDGGEDVALIGHGHHLLAMPSLMTGKPVDPKKLASLDQEHEPGGVYGFHQTGTTCALCA